MDKRGISVLIMAAGTGGHVFPALSIAELFIERNVGVQWLGTPKGMENDILKQTNIPLHRISVKGLRGSGLLRILLSPFMLISAFVQSFQVLGKVRPDFVLGMGGFVCGPAGLACKVRGIPLFIHEQNSVPGLTNKILAPLALGIFEAFPGTFKSRSNVTFTGNPLRKDFLQQTHADSDRFHTNRPLKLLVLGGSQGATAINEVIPPLIAKISSRLPLETLHQVGKKHMESAQASYDENKIAMGKSHRVVPFIDDVRAAMDWADLVICRSGASTVSEIAAVGCPAIFIPYPHHKDQQQKLNAEWLAEEQAAVLLEQKELDVSRLSDVLLELTAQDELLHEMGIRARKMAVLDASQRIVDSCLEVIRVP